MRIRRVLGISVLVAGIGLTANAQASRTWVSGVGDDVNPCSRSAPCKTWAGAISKTAAGGEIDALDPAGFGAVTITKSITFEGADFVASVLVSGTNGIVIQAGPNDHVHLRNLSINGIGTGINGLQILSGAQVIVEGCTIFDFPVSGIRIAPTSGIMKVAISNTSIRNSGGWGVLAAPAGGTVLLSLDHVRVTGTTGIGATGAGVGSGVQVDGASADIVDSILSENAAAGLFVRNGAEVNVHGTGIFRNATGISCGDAGGGTVRLFGSSVVTNSNGIAIISGNVISHGNNAIAGNGGTQAVSSNINTQ